MRWFKHLSGAHQDEKMARLVANLGLEGYGFYWLVLETVAGQIEAGSDRTSVCYPIAFWRKITGFSPKKLRVFAENCSDFGIFTAEFSENSLTIDVAHAMHIADRSSELDVSTSQWKKLRAMVFERDGFTCRYCGASPKLLDCDHVMPRSRGGKSSLDNLVTACPSCNRSKSARTPEEWLQ